VDVEARKRETETELPWQDLWGCCCLAGLGQEVGEARWYLIPNPWHPLHQVTVWAVQTHLLIPRFNFLETSQ